MRFKILLTSIAILAVGGAWLHEYTEAIRLQAELDLARDAHRELTLLQSENQQLKSKQPDSDRLTALRRAHAEHNRLLVELDARKATPPPPPFSVGEWSQSRVWANRGSATPRNAVETVLWAAAGGDTSTLESMLELDSAALARASAFLNTLPPEYRNAYPAPQALIASVTTKNIPLGKAQVTWLREFDPDHAVVGLVMSNPDGTSAPAPPQDAGVPSPMLPENGKYKFLTLSLHRTGAGWRLVVPAPAIDRMAHDLVAATK